MLGTGTDLMVAHQSRSAEGRVHFIKTPRGSSGSSLRATGKMREVRGKRPEGTRYPGGRDARSGPRSDSPAAPAATPASVHTPRRVPGHPWRYATLESRILAEAPRHHARGSGARHRRGHTARGTARRPRG